MAHKHDWPRRCWIVRVHSGRASCGRDRQGEEGLDLLARGLGVGWECAAQSLTLSTESQVRSQPRLPRCSPMWGGQLAVLEKSVTFIEFFSFSFYLQGRATEILHLLARSPNAHSSQGQARPVRETQLPEPSPCCLPGALVGSWEWKQHLDSLGRQASSLAAVQQQDKGEAGAVVCTCYAPHPGFGVCKSPPGRGPGQDRGRTGADRVSDELPVQSLSLLLPGPLGRPFT